jgi:hypothetical protein
MSLTVALACLPMFLSSDRESDFTANRRAPVMGTLKIDFGAVKGTGEVFLLIPVALRPCPQNIFDKS